MKAFTPTLSILFSSIFFSSTALADIVTETGPNGMIVAVKYIPDGGTLRKRVSPSGNSDCAKWCAANFPHPGSECTSLAAHGKGPCYICGPRRTSATEKLCGGECRQTSSDSNNCGGCGNVVSDGRTTCKPGACMLTSYSAPLLNLVTIVNVLVVVQ